MNDVGIVGAGPAGLSAALMLARCCRSIQIFDDERPRDRPSPVSHGFFTRDGESPARLRELGREQLARYGVDVELATVIDASRESDGFTLNTQDGRSGRVRALLVASGLSDNLPAVPGFREIYGKTAWKCPYCDGYEVRGMPVAAMASGVEAVAFAIAMQTWSSDIALLTHGETHLSGRHRASLARRGIRWYPQPIAHFESVRGQLQQIVFADGAELERRALFFQLGSQQRSNLPRTLGCRLDSEGRVRAGRTGATSVAGVYVAGDASPGALLAAIASAEGAEAAVAIHKYLSACFGHPVLDNAFARVEPQAAPPWVLYPARH